MERETRMLLWTLFGIGVLTVAFLPAAWTSLNHDTAIGVESNANMAQVLWGQAPSVPAYVTGWARDMRVPIIPGAVDAHVESVSWDTSTWGPQLVISGYGFGNPPAPGKASLTIADQSRGWVAGNAPTYGVQPVIALWRNDRIVVSGWSGYGESDGSNWSDGLGSWVFAPGDSLVISVTNPQTGNTGTFGTQYTVNASMPTISLNSIPTIVAGQSIDLTGHVTWQGHPLSNQAVSVSTSIGTLGGTAYPSNPSEYVVYTDANGNFSIPFTASSGATGQVTVQAMSDGVTITGNFAIILPVPTLTVISPNPLPSNVPTGEDVIFQANANVLPVGDQLIIVKENGGGKTMASGTNLPLSASWSEQSPGEDTYVSEIIGPVGQVVVTSSPITINWSDPLSITVTEFTPDGSDGWSSEHEYYLAMSVVGSGLTRIVQLTNFTHPGTTFPGNFYWVQSGGSNPMLST